MALATFADWRDSAKSLSGVAATAGIIQIPIAKAAEDLPESVPLESVTPSFFTVLGVTPLVGRAPDQSNVYVPGRSDGGVALSERLWRTRFAADPSIVGQTIRIGSPPRPVPVVGILPAAFQPLGTTDVWEVIFSVLMFMVQRAREFSVRLAVGASARDLLQLVLGGALKLTAIGVGIGVVASALLVRSLGTLLFGVAPLDPLTFVASPLMLTLVSLVACLVPAIRARRADPVAALRAE